MGQKSKREREGGRDNERNFYTKQENRERHACSTSTSYSIGVLMAERPVMCHMQHSHIGGSRSAHL